MKTLLATGFALFLLASCNKEVCVIPPSNDPIPDPSPTMRYTDLDDSKVPFGRFQQVDLDGNGSNDFTISTLLVGSPANQTDLKQFLFSGAFFSYSPVDDQEQMPILIRGQKIGEKVFPNHQWYNASHLLLSQLVIPATGQPFWNGGWMDASHRYVAISILREEKMYYGWVELSFDKQQASVVLHKAAISLEPGREVKAGI